MRRILHVTRDLAPRSTGGISTAVAGLVRALEAAGARCAVVSFDAWRPRARGGVGHPPIAADEGVPVLRVSRPDQLEAAHAFAAGFAPTVVHAHAGLLWPFVREIRERLQVPAVKTVHVLQVAQNRVLGVGERTMSLVAQETALAEADLVLAPSRAVAARVGAEYPFAIRKLRVTPLATSDAPAARAAVDAPRGPLVLAAGRFAEVKGTDVLLAALPSVMARLPETRCALAGGLPENRRAERRWLARVPAAIAARVEHRGWIDDLSPLFGRAAVVVVPSRFETFGQTALEAMLHGAPVVASRAGALPELVEHEVTGLLVPAGDPDALADAIVRLSNDPTRAQALGRAAAARARERHLWPHTLPALLEAYAEVD